MRKSLLVLLAALVALISTQSTFESTISSSTSEFASTSTDASNSSPSSSFPSSNTFGSSDSTVTGTSGATNNVDSTTSASLDDDSEKMVTYTTKQKSVFIACCGGTFVLLIALAILSGMSDTIARSRQKTKRTHA